MISKQIGSLSAELLQAFAFPLPAYLPFLCRYHLYSSPSLQLILLFTWHSVVLLYQLASTHTGDLLHLGKCLFPPCHHVVLFPLQRFFVTNSLESPFDTMEEPSWRTVLSDQYVAVNNYFFNFSFHITVKLRLAWFEESTTCLRIWLLPCLSSLIYLL